MKTLAMLTLAGALTCVAPAFADDSTSTATTPSAQQQCRTERSQMGTTTFAQTYGTNANRANAFGRCVSKRNAATTTAAQTAHANAARSCKAERTADPAAFKTKYGTGKNGANAYGKCVSAQAKAKQAKLVKTEVTTEISAAKSCKSERKADAAAFTKKYGTGSGRNAFGRCVSSTAKAKQQQSGSQS